MAAVVGDTDAGQNLEAAPLLDENTETDSHVPDNVDAPTAPVVPPPINPAIGTAPPAYSEAPPPYTPMPFSPTSVTPQPPSVMGEPTVVCRVCQQLIFIRGRESQRVVKCANCHEATPIKPPPNGKKYIRCPCNALLTCRATSNRISCPRANCKRIINVGGSPPAPSANGAPTPTTVVQGSDARVRVKCGHCNETFVFRTTAHLARCPYCRKVSSVGSSFAKSRALLFAIIGVIFIGAGIGVTLATLDLAKSSGGIYVVWTGAFIAGLLNLIRSFYYLSMTISHVEGQA